MDKKRLSLEFKVGLFVISAILLLFIFIFTQTKKGEWRGYEIGVTFDYIGGLDIGAPVRLSGVRVGEVRSIKILSQPKPKVLVKLRLKRDVKIAKNSRITIRTLGIIGEKYVEILPSTEKEYISKGEIVEGVNPLSFEKFVTIGQDVIFNLNNILTDLRKLTSDVKIQKNIRKIVNETAKTSEQMNTVLNKLNTLLVSVNKTNKEIRKVIKENSPRVAKVLDNTNALVLTSKSEIEKTMRDIRKFTETGKEVKKAIAKLENTTDKINTFIEKLQSEGLIAQIMEDKDLLNQIKTEVKHLQDTTLKLKSSAESFIKMTENINSLLDYVNQGKGSIGKFVKSDQLYDEVLDFVKDIKAHPWKLFIRKR